MRQEFDDMLTEMICYGEYLDYQPTVKKFVNLPEIVCLCGSTRFMKEFEEWNLKLTLQGKIVLSVGCNTKSAGLGITAALSDTPRHNQATSVVSAQKSNFEGGEVKCLRENTQA